MAHKKGQGSTNNGRDSNSKRLGVKLFGGQLAIAGNIIIRQRGTRFHPGDNVGMGKDHTIYALVDGTVAFRKKKNNRSYISIVPFDEIVEKAKAPKAKKVEKVVKEKVEPVVEAKKEVKEQSPKEEAPKVEKKPKAEKKPAKAEKVVLSAEDTDKAKAEIIKKIGTVKEGEKDDLKKISGVGPVLEKKLNEIGIFTFAQVGKMTKAEYDLMDSITTSFPGRAERDDWAGQAKELSK